MSPPELSPGGSKLDYAGFWVVWLALVAGTWLFFRRTRGRRGVPRLVAGNLLVFASLSWTALVVGETYLRFVHDQTDQYGLTMTNVDWFLRHARLNSRFFRDDEWTAEKPPDVARVACVGDSFTMGWGVRDVRDSWPRLVAKGLESGSPARFEVRNYAAPGAETGYEADLMETSAKTDAWDRVVLGYCLNDPDDLLPRSHVFSRDDAPRAPGYLHSYVLDFLWYRLRLRKDPRVEGYFDWVKEAYDDPKIWAAQCARFARMAETCRRRSVRLDVVVFPFFSAWGPDYGYDSCHERVVEAWRRLGIEAIDLREAYRGIPGADLVVNRFDAHPNERAHAIAARVILERAFGVR